MVSVKVEGTEQLAKIARVLEDSGNSKALKRRMGRAFRKVADPISRGMREKEATGLPQRGGAASLVSSELKATVRTNYARPSVDIVDSWPGHDIKSIEAGRLRHPLFEHRLSLFSANPLAGGALVGRRSGEWFVTDVPPGLLEEAFDEHKPEVVAELARTMDELAEEIARET